MFYFPFNHNSDGFISFITYNFTNHLFPPVSIHFILDVIFHLVLFCWLTPFFLIPS